MFSILPKYDEINQIFFLFVVVVTLFCYTHMIKIDFMSVSNSVTSESQKGVKIVISFA